MWFTEHPCTVVLKEENNLTRTKAHHKQNRIIKKTADNIASLKLWKQKLFTLLFGWLIVSHLFLVYIDHRKECRTQPQPSLPRSGDTLPVSRKQVSALFIRRHVSLNWKSAHNQKQILISGKYLHPGTFWNWSSSLKTTPAFIWYLKSCVEVS